MLKALHAFLLALLVYIAWLQLNDPDPLFWVLLYLLAASAPLLALIDRPLKSRPYLLGLASGFCLAGMAMVLGGASVYLQHLGEDSLIQDMSADKPYIEEARELIGALIALIIVAGYSWNECRKSR